MKNLRLIYASATGALASIIFTFAITIAAEFSAPFKNWLASVSGHHWVTKSIFCLIVYIFISYYIYSISKNISPAKTRASVERLTAGVIIAAVGLIAFYAWHYFQG
ncbi:MAG: hypothetical protein HY336_02525 [Candidatus Doudnabacteria bacterium]|nr:hypothetical protein [Candidatus Doudnabacteria bacterium]